MRGEAQIEAVDYRTEKSAETGQFVPSRTIVLVGLMGAGKSKIGRRLAARLGLPFFDSDTEIEARPARRSRRSSPIAARRSFRDGERRVIARLLAQPVHVLATGGGAFMDPATRTTDRARAVFRSGCAPISTCWSRGCRAAAIGRC